MRKLTRLLAGLACLLFLPQLLFSQNTAISGTVIDPAGNPLAGVSIIIQGTTKGTTTNADGKFQLPAPANAKLVISSAGFKNKIVSASGADLNIRLEEDIAHLDEVVVTGLATTIKRRNLANAVGTISSRELAGVAPAQTLDAALEGKVTGAYINANSGSPGGGISVKLRGVTSVYGNTQPLYVIDGVYVDNTSTSSGLNTITGAASPTCAPKTSKTSRS